MVAEPRPSPADGSRDLRLDLLRGLCLLKMVFNHLWHTPLHAAQDWLGFVSAAEGFFLISGVVSGIVFGRRARTEGLTPASAALARRGVHLYLGNLALVFLFFALEVTRLLPYRGIWNENFHWRALFDFNQPYFLQVLPRYALFLAAAPAALWCLVRGRTAWLIAGAAALWLGNLLLGTRVRVPGLEDGEIGGFLLVAWQGLFFGGMAIGFHRHRLGQRWRRLPAWASLGLTALLWAAGIALERAVAFGALAWEEPSLWLWVGRDHLGPLRLLNLAAAAAVLFALTDRFWEPIRRFAGPILLPFGQSALYLFLVHILLSGLVQVLEPRLPFALAGHLGRLILADAILLSLHWLAARFRPFSGWIPG